MSLWTTPYHLLRDECVQRLDEGCVIPADLRARIDALDSRADAWSARTERLHDELAALPADPALAAREPDEWDESRRLCPPAPSLPAWSPGEAELLDRLHGAWTFRAAGCALGKPVENWSAPDIRRYLLARDAWPLRDYFSLAAAIHPGAEDLRLHASCHASAREHIAFMEPDDDIHYTLVALAVLERAGPGFRWADVAAAWRDLLPVGALCTAEAQAMINLLPRSAQTSAHGWGIASGEFNLAAAPAFTRSHRNPFREWIGAQIRSDGWAWAAAGDPALAADFAYRDACWTHTRNGIYGALFFAAVQAAAFVEREPTRLVEIGLAHIPAECRLARLVRQVRDWCAVDADWEATLARVQAVCAGMSPVHTINNAAVCVLALLHGRGDPARSLSIAVSAGWDTDCNGATVGSVLGAMHGRRALPAAFAEPLRDRCVAKVIGFTEISFTELARRHAAVWRCVRESAPPH